MNKKENKTQLKTITILLTLEQKKDIKKAAKNEPVCSWAKKVLLNKAREENEIHYEDLGELLNDESKEINLTNNNNTRPGYPWILVPDEYMIGFGVYRHDKTGELLQDYCGEIYRRRLDK